MRIETHGTRASDAERARHSAARAGGSFPAWAAGHGGATVAALGACMLAAYLAAIVFVPKPDGRIVFGDATHEYVQLRSLVFDHDLDFRNDYSRLYGLTGAPSAGTEWVTTELTATGHVRNYMPVGPALLWAPLYLVVAAVQTLLARVGVGAAPDGFGRALQTVPGVAGIISATLAAWLSWRLARRLTDARSALLATVAVWLGSSALYYSLVSPNYSHAASMLACACFFSYWISTTGDRSPRRAAMLGALAGFAALMRWQDAILLGVPVLDSLLHRAPWRARLVPAGAAALGWVVAFSPQMIVWQVLYGRPLAVPQGPSFLQWRQPHLVAVLLSDNHGLFSWTPLVVFAVVGLTVLVARRRVPAMPLAFVLIASWYVNASVADWWAGEAFGARRFLSLFPLFVAGLATWLGGTAAAARLRAARVALVAILVAMNLLLLLQYQIFMKGLHQVAGYPNGWFGLGVERFAVPFRLLAWWLR